MKERLSVHMMKLLNPKPLQALFDSLDNGIRLTVGMSLPDKTDYHILIAPRPERKHIAASPNLHTLIVPLSGVPSETRKLLLDFPQIDVYNFHHHAGTVAEMAVALMLAAAKGLIPKDRALRNNDWSSRYVANTWMFMEGKTALILGYGAIGRKVADKCRGLGMNIMAIRRDKGRIQRNHSVTTYTSDSLHDLLPRANALIICLPLTKETEGMIGIKELRMLPPGATLVNVGRARIVHEESLFNALKKGILYAAGLDVWYDTPTNEASRCNTPPSSHPFHELDNVVLSPHLGGGAIGGDAGEMRSVETISKLINAAARGKPLPHRVNVLAGY